MSEYSILQTRVLGVRITNIIKRDGKVIDKITAVQDLINLTTRVAELESQLNNRPESEAERAIVEYVAIDEALDKPCAEWTNEECNRHRKASQALKDLARKLAGETTAGGGE